MGDLFPNQPSAVSPLCNPAIPCSASLSSPVFLEQNWGRPGLTLDSDIHGHKSSFLYNYIPGHPTPLISGAAMRAVPDTHHTKAATTVTRSLRKRPGVGGTKASTHWPPTRALALETGHRSQVLPSGDLSRGLRADKVGLRSCILKAINVGLLILPPKKGTCLVTEQTALLHATENFHLHFLDCAGNDVPKSSKCLVHFVLYLLQFKKHLLIQM